MSNFAISKLNEYCQHRQLPTPKYITFKTDGSSHMPIFMMKVIVDECEFKAEGTNKKAAKSKCAALAIQELNVDEYFNNRMKEYRYRICKVSAPSVPEELNSIEALWKDETEEIVLTIKRSNDLDEHDHKIIKLRVLK